MQTEKNESEQVVELILEGKGPTEINAKFPAFHKSTLSNMRRALGVKNKLRRGRHIDTKTREMVSALKAKGFSYREIGGALGMSYQRAQQLLLPENHKELKADGKCSKCGEMGMKTQCHHTDYTGGPVVALCPSCHGKAHHSEASVKACEAIKITHEAFSSQVRDWRNRQGISQRDAAAMLGVSVRTYEKWEQGVMSPRGFGLAALLKKISVR